MTKHGHYNGGVSEMPVLVTTAGQDLLVAVWMSMDDHNYQGGATGDMAFFKLFTRASLDNGLTWTPMQQLTADFMFQLSEFAYPQAAITGNTLVIACQEDGEPDSYLIGTGGDLIAEDNFYQAFTFDLTELFPEYDGVEEQVSNNTLMNVYPNPAVDQLNITLNQNADITVFNMVGQVVMTTEGHVGVNTINISNLTAGVYFVNAGSATTKFVVK
jgi:hypothetical protein